ncbi:ABC transporter substrate-binding protein [Streptomyces xiaopingdaonensis]|uniref:ABC transporter substrate-binding protein n=1 Tax=Streptomyces xiaopingdaonensis TaxID=1565415 RepID=UPI0003134B5C|nr:ABC transporter substrate-binding protein [Streptomyces xiaopingdaonensis]
MPDTTARSSPSPPSPERRFMEITAAGRRYVSDSGFFAARPHLEEIAGRALSRAEDEPVGFLDVRGSSLMRITVESTGGPPRTVRLEAQPATPPFGLTGRELQVATCMAGGLTTPEIAGALGCSRTTAATHTEHVLAKSGLRSRAAVATMITALRAHTLPVPTDDLVLPPALAELLKAPVRNVPARTGPERQPITVGLVYPAGSAAGVTDQRPMRQGALLALRELEERGLAGRAVRYTAVEATADRLAHAVGTLAEAGANAVLLGNFQGTAVPSAVARAAGPGTPVLHSMIAPALAAAVDRDPHTLSHVFQACADENAYLYGFLRTLRVLEASRAWRPRARRLALLLRRSTFDDVFVDGLARAVERAGWDLALVERVDEQHTAWDAVAQRLERADPAAVFLSVLPEHALRDFLMTTVALRTRTLVHTAWAPTAPGFTERLGKLSQGLVWSTIVGVHDTPQAAAFAQRYRASYGGDPGLGAAAVHYDLVHALAAAWASVDRPWNHRAVQQHLRTVPYRGVAGVCSFAGPGQRGLAYPDDTHDPSTAHPHLAYRITGDRHHLLPG